MRGGCKISATGSKSTFWESGCGGAEGSGGGGDSGIGGGEVAGMGGGACSGSGGGEDGMGGGRMFISFTNNNNA